MSASAQPTGAEHDTQVRNQILRQAGSIALAVSPFAAAFGIICAEADFRLIEAIGFSSLVFGGSAQFAAATVLADGGSVVAAVTAGALLNMRSMAFGVVMAPALKGSLWWRGVVSQLMIDESTAVGSAQKDLHWRRYGYLAGGLGVFVLWNLFTILGFTVLGSAGELVVTYGIDATIPASFLALLWPRLDSVEQRVLMVAGAAIALLGAPLLPAGVPIVASALAVVIYRPWRLPERWRTS
ncbi:MAG: AzlC family ABC transporter permease [Acidimicrobiales bacterium]|nr:AzlC family ABC transporter permease [Acidimicrobiales bacterium]